MGTILSEPRMAQYNRIGDDAISDGHVRHAADVTILRAGYLGGSGASMGAPRIASDVTLAVNRFVLSVIGPEGRNKIIARSDSCADSYTHVSCRLRG
jgi:hypothetical protein